MTFGVTDSPAARETDCPSAQEAAGASRHEQERSTDGAQPSAPTPSTAALRLQGHSRAVETEAVQPAAKNIYCVAHFRKRLLTPGKDPPTPTPKKKTR